MNSERIRVTKLHKRWADRYSLMWIVFALLLVTRFQFVLDRAGVEASEGGSDFPDRAARAAGGGLVGGWPGNCQGAYNRERHRSGALRMPESILSPTKWAFPT
jgi:hypothetical protein